MSSYDVYKLNRINLALPALDKAMLRCVDDDEVLTGLAAGYTRLMSEQFDLQRIVADACAPWFKVWR
jgi:hypothetical protein